LERVSFSDVAIRGPDRTVLDNAEESRYTTDMAFARSHLRPIALGLVAVLVVGMAIITALFATGEIGGRRLKGEILIVESQVARFDREVHASLAGATTPSKPEDPALCHSLADEVDVSPHAPVVLYDERGFVLARGMLGDAQFSTTDSTPDYVDVEVCRLSFSVGDLRPSRSVTVEIGSQLRGTFETADLDARDWNLELVAGRCSIACAAPWSTPR
jgi:hypothetical protein